MIINNWDPKTVGGENQTIRREEHCSIKKDDRGDWPGGYSEEEQADLAVKISLMTFETAVLLERLGFKDFWNSKMERVMRKWRESKQEKKKPKNSYVEKRDRKWRIVNEKIIDIFFTSLWNLGNIFACSKSERTRTMEIGDRKCWRWSWKIWWPV